MQHHSPRSISSSQSPVETHDRDRERFERSREHERVMPSHRRAHHRDSRSRSPPGPPVPLGARPQQQHGQAGGPTALPSIHHLHPDLPPPHAHAHPRHAGPAMQQQPQYSPSEFLPGASYGHGTSPFFAGTQQRSPISASTLPSSYPPSAYDERRIPFERPLPPGAGTRTRPPQSSSSAYPPEPRASPPDLESDQEHNESERGPPKKKRRGQALSCTECKRRKIKCDRTHPCGPCARRSEPEKCQWHVIEPVDKYVTRSEWDDLYMRYRMLEERCIRLEKLVVQMHPELTEHSPYEVSVGHPPTLPSPNAQRSVSMRGFPLAGPGISGAGTAGSAANSGGQRVTPSTPLSALPGPSPRSGPRSNMAAQLGSAGTGTVSISGTENTASIRSGSAPPPLLGTTAQPHSQTQAQSAMSSTHPPPHSDRRRTSAPGSHASLTAPSERYHVQGQNQVPSETAPPSAMHPRDYPLTAPSPHSYTFPPPPPPAPPIPEDSHTHTSSRDHGYAGFTYGRSGVSGTPESSNISSPGMGRYTTARSSGQPISSRHASVSGGYYSSATATDPANEDAEGETRFSSRYEREHILAYGRRERRISDPKNGEAQASEAGDALRHHRPASPAHESKRSFSAQGLIGPASALSGNFVGHAKIIHPRSDDSTPSSPRLDSPESLTPPRKRTRHGSLYLNIPPCGSSSGTPPPIVVVH